MALWSCKSEKKFFLEALERKISPEKLFYRFGDDYFAYVDKNQANNGQTIQSRNSLIGSFTEIWCKELLKPISEKIGLFAINNVVCEEIGLTNQSDGDIALCLKEGKFQKPENIKIVFEVKMSIVSNYQYKHKHGELKYYGDYKSHKGNPSLLRSDSMLKAIGKAINIRVSGPSSTTIPIVIIGNTPINKSYIKKVDHLKNSGIVQGFISVYPKPSESNFIKETPEKGFQTVEDFDYLEKFITELAGGEVHYFSSMLSKKRIGQIIGISNKEKCVEKKAETFLNLLRG